MACSDSCKRMCTEMLSFVRQNKKLLSEFEATLCELLEKNEKEQVNDIDQHQQTDDERASPILSLGPLNKFEPESEKGDKEEQTPAQEKEAPNNTWCRKHGDYCGNGECD